MTFEQLMKLAEATDEEYYLCLQYLCLLRLREIWRNEET